MITFNKDPCIKSKYFIDNKPNIYWAYVWKEDLKDIEYRRRIPWIKVNKKEIIKYINFISKDQKTAFKILIKGIQEYTQLEFKSQKDFVRSLRYNIENSIIDMITLRVLCLITSEITKKSDIKLFFNILSKSDYVTDYSNLGRFTPPLSKKELLNKNIIYIAGCQAGDGYLSQKYRATITDGNKDIKKLHYSKKHILEINKQLNKIFNTYSFINTDKRFYTLIIKNKWYVRHLHKFFDLPIGKKKDKLKEPIILKTIEEKCTFWRGIFDSDGNAQNLTLELVNSSRFLNQLKSLLKEINVDYRKSKGGFKDRITIKKKDLIRFNNHIGFKHPRKKEEIKQSISKGSKFRIFNGLKPNSITKEEFYDLNKIKDLMVHGFGETLKAYKNKSNISYYKIADLCNLSHSTIITAFQNKNSISLKNIIKFYNSIGLKSDDLYKDLQKNPKIRFCNKKGRGMICLPLVPNKEVFKTLSYLRPQKRNKITYVITDYKKNQIKEKLELIRKIFKAKISKDKQRNLIYSKSLYDFLNTFHKYEKPW